MGFHTVAVGVRPCVPGLRSCFLICPRDLGWECNILANRQTHRSIRTQRRSRGMRPPTHMLSEEAPEPSALWPGPPGASGGQTWGRAQGVSCSLRYPWLRSQAPACALLIYLHWEVEEVLGGCSNRIHLVPQSKTNLFRSGSGGQQSSAPAAGRAAPLPAASGQRRRFPETACDLGSWALPSIA